MFFTCTFAVCSLMPSVTAISLLRMPSAMSRTTSTSRGVSGGCLSASGERCFDVAAKRLPARVHLANHAHEILRERVLQEIGGRAGFERAVDVLVALIHREHHDPRVRVGLPDLADGVEAAHTRQLQIHQRDVRLHPDDAVDRFFAVGGGPHDFHVGLAADEQRQAFQHHAVIVHTEDANALAHF